MKILIVSYEFPPIIGGAGMYAHDLAIGLAKNSCKVDIATYVHDSRTGSIKKDLKSKYGIVTHTINPLTFFHFLQFAFLINRIIRRYNYDKIILSDARAKRIFALFSFLFRGDIDKSISVFHGNEIDSIFVSPSRIIKLFSLDRKLFKLFSKQNLLVTVSENEKQLWESRFPEFRHKIYLVRHGVNEDVFYCRSSDEIELLKLDLNIPVNKKIIISASRLVEKKGQDNLIMAFSNIIKYRTDVHLLIVGDGEYMPTLKAQAEMLGISRHLNFIGGVDRVMLSKYYSVSDIFVLTSRFIESFGLVYIEAAACGVPSIAGNLGGVSDAVVDNSTGLIIGSNDYDALTNSIEYLLKNEQVRRDMANAGMQRFLNQFTCKISASNLIKALK